MKEGLKERSLPCSTMFRTSNPSSTNEVAHSHFSLAVSLWMTCCAKHETTIKFPPKGPPNQKYLRIFTSLLDSMDLGCHEDEQQLKWSTTDRTESRPCRVLGRPSMKSMERSSQTVFGIGNGVYNTGIEKCLGSLTIIRSF